MFKHLLEFLFGLDKGFFSAEGELKLQFDPHWPGPLVGAAGSWPNYALGLAAIGLLVILFRKSRSRELERVRLTLAVACTAIILVAVPFAAGWVQNAGTHAGVLAGYAAVAVGVVALEAWFFRSGNEYGRTVLGRVALFAFLLCVVSGTLSWNLILAATGALVVLYVYPRDGRSVGARTFLGILRAGLVAFVLLLLNNPILTRTRNLTEPSVVAVLVDDSLSMKVRDVSTGQATSGPTRLEAAVDLLTGEDQALIKRLAKVHSLRFYSFDRNARALGAVAGVDERKKKDVIPVADGSLLQAMQKLAPEGNSTQVIPSILTVLDDLQGQRLAGVVLLTDGRDTPTSPLAEAFKTLSNYQVKVYPVSVGSDKAPQNIELQSISVQDSAFKDDIVNVKLVVRATGYEAGHAVKLKITEKKTGLQLKDPDGKFAEKVIHVADDKPIEQELLFKPDQVGPLDIKVEAEKQPGELDEEDNARTAQISVLDAKINVLYVEGYPRWEYRYIKNEMIRDRTVNISCILTSADPTFIQEHTDMKSRGESEKFKYFPYSQFPVTMEQLMETDVVLFGDVDPRQFADVQLQLIADFVNKKGGGFGMIAGPQWSPAAYRNTPIETLLPVYPVRTEIGWPTEPITEGFRPVLTKEGAGSSIFRFFTDKPANESYLKNQLQPLFWYCHGITVKPGVGEVYAEHPFDLGPDGRKAPLLVLGRFGAGRTLFSAYDDSWRWRYYTGESVFDTYWVQQLRYLARSKKLGQRQLTFTADRTTYQQGDQVRVAMRVLNPVLLQQLPPEIAVQVKNEEGQLVRAEKLQKEAGQPDYYTASFSADRLGRFTLSLPPLVGDTRLLDLPIEVIVPRLELADPQVDHTLLSRVAIDTAGQALTLAEARAKLPDLIQSAARTIPLVFSRPLWDKPAALVIFMLLITIEWVLRKVYGMV
ncbi:MAG: hypothetical protein JWO87_2147 [Phycisphaerales bacterium]|jgi:uncharacterized membrane protein|nr:hypothetical protein [Phycisphaerales bacterium]MDB5304536.1 hypothetical protein [Phycisphaerales bacterium]